MMRVIASGYTDVGRVRKANEDAYHVGDSVFAVADGMGGHLAGEVASTTALEPIAELDGRVFADANEATQALCDAVIAANDAVVDKAANDPSYRGMGTTLTALMIEGRRAHVAHVGDSRAYLLRAGSFSQLTTDHTLVQRLIEEGRLTREEAAQHPQRSVITRAIGVEPEVEVDALVLELEPGDILLLCSDGLTGPLSDEKIAKALENEDVETAVKTLVDNANLAGGPDNITAVVVRFEELEITAAGGREPQRENVAAGGGTVQVRTRTDESSTDDWASRLGRFGRLNPDHTRPSEDDRRPSKLPRIAAVLVVVALIVGAVVGGGRWMLSRSYFVGTDGDQVVIYQGIPGDFGPFSLSWEHEETDLTVDDVPPLFRDQVREGMTAADLADARRIVANFEDRADGPSDGGTTSETEPS